MPADSAVDEVLLGDVDVETEDGQDEELRDDLSGEADKQVGATIEIVAPGLTFRREIPQERAIEIITALVTGASLGSPGISAPRSGAGLGTGADGRRPVSLPEFYRTAQPKVNAAKLATFALYHDEHRNQKSMSTEELKACFRMVNEMTPANLTRDLRVASGTLGWLAQDPNDATHYYITQRGIDAVHSSFIDVGTRRSSKRRRPRSAPAMVSEAQDEPTE